MSGFAGAEGRWTLQVPNALRRYRHSQYDYEPLRQQYFIHRYRSFEISS